jgi:hypothetical protein
MWGCVRPRTYFLALGIDQAATPKTKRTRKLSVAGMTLLATVCAPPGAMAECTDTFNITSVGGPGQMIFPMGVGNSLNALLSTINSVNTAFLTNTISFVSAPGAPKADQDGGGIWARSVAGYAETKATSTSTLDQLHNNPKPIFSFTGTGTCTGTVREEYTGTQFGFDLYKLNVANTGANFHLGITGGYFNSQAKDISVAPVSTAVDIPDGNFVADSKVPFAGVYAVYTQGGFFADTQLRFDFYKNTVSDPSNGLGGQSLNARGMSVTGNVGYNIKLPSNWFIEPSVGAVWSRVQVDRFNAPGVIAPVTDPVIFPAQQFAVFSKGFVEFEDIESLLGRATLRFGATIANGDYVWQPFASVSVLHEYAENVHARSEISGFSILLDGSGLNMSTSRVGTYAQYGIGSGLVLGDSGWLGYGRVDYKTGENIEGVNVNFGLRKQW